MTEWIVSSAALTALVIGLRYALKGKISLRLQYALWALVLVRLLLPVSFGSVGFSVGSLTKRAAETRPVRAVISVVQTTERPQEDGTGTGSDITPTQTEVQPSAAWSLGEILRMIWLLGAVTVGVVLLVCNLRFARVLKRSRRRVEGLTSPLPVWFSAAIDTPCLFGLFRPAVYLTPETAQGDPILRHCIAHELTHYHHGDHLWSILRGVCLALHWFDPLVWWAAVLSREDAELACDEATIKRIGETERAEYGRTLIAVTCCKRPTLLLTATTMTGSGIKERIVMLAKKPKTTALTLTAVVLTAAVLAGCTFTGAQEPQPTEPTVTVGMTISESTIVSEELRQPTEPTGYPSGEVQQSMLFAKGQLYVYNSQGTQPPPEGCRELGTILAVRNDAMPEAELEASRLPLGAKVFDAGYALFVQTSEEGYLCMMPPACVSTIPPERESVDDIGPAVDIGAFFFGLHQNAESAAETFVCTTFGYALTSLPSGNNCRALDYEVLDWSVLEIAEDGKAVVGWFACAVTPEDLQTSALWGGNTEEGTGDLEGKLTFYREFCLQQNADGAWSCIELGTGGVHLPQQNG